MLVALRSYIEESDDRKGALLFTAARISWPDPQMSLDRVLLVRGICDTEVDIRPRPANEAVTIDIFHSFECTREILDDRGENEGTRQTGP